MTRRSWPHRHRPDARQLLGAEPVCLDTMAVTAMARAGRSQLLHLAMGARARITPRVAGELRGHARDDERIAALIPLPPGAPRAANALGDVVQLTRDEALLASDFQRRWNGKAVIDANPAVDRGEAEAVAVAMTRKWTLVSQDHHAVGPPERRRQFVVGLPELLLLIAAEGHCGAQRAWEIYRLIADPEPRLVCQGWPCSVESQRLFSSCYDAMVARLAVA